MVSLRPLARRVWTDRFASGLSLHRDVLPILGLALLQLVLDGRLLTGQWIGLTPDGLLQYFPAEFALARSLKMGELPLWSPQIQTGFPLLASGQPGPLYPIHLLLFRWLPPVAAHNWSLMLHAWFGATGMYIWGRHSFGLSRAGAAVSAILFSLYGGLQLDIYPAIAIAWTPWIFWGSGRMLTSGRGAFWVGCMIGCQWLTGFPQIVFISQVGLFLLIGFTLLDRWWGEKERGRIIKPLFLWILVCGLGLALSAGQLLPTIELARFSPRGAPDPAMLGYNSLFPGTLITYLIPAWRPIFRAAALGESQTLGLFGLVLASVGLMCGRKCRPLLIWMGIGIVLSLGSINPLFELLIQLPGFNLLRAPSRFLLWVQLGGAILAGIGFDQMNDRQLQDRVLSRAAVGVGLSAGLVGGAGFLFRLVEERITQFGYAQMMIRIDDRFHPQPLSFFETKLDQMLTMIGELTGWQSPHISLSIGVGGLVWALWVANKSAGFHHARLLFLAALLVEGLWIQGWGRALQPVSILDEPEIVALIAGFGPSARLYRDIDTIDLYPEQIDSLAHLPSNSSLLFGYADVGIYNPLGFAGYDAALGAISPVDLAFGLEPVEVSMLKAGRERLDRFGVTLILSRAAIDLPATSLIGEEGGLYLYENETAYPRAFWTSARSADLRIAQTIVHESAHQVVVQVDAPQDGVLVLNDAYFPGWRVRVDGRSAEMFVANDVFRGVALTQGAHLVEFEYRPRSFQIGMGVSILALLSLIGVQFASSIRKVLFGFYSRFIPA